MKRYYLGVMMLALAAAGVVWLAIQERRAATPATPATAAVAAPPTASASTPLAAPTEAIQIGDGGHLAAVDPTFPPLAADPAWSVVRWNMSAADVEAAFRKAGVVVVDATDTKTGAKRLRAKSDAFDATIELGAKGVDRIVVTTTGLSKEGAQAVVAKVEGRAPATKTIRLTERRWKKDGGATVSLLTQVDGTTTTVREAHVRESAPGGEIGFLDLRWGMSTQEAFGHLRAAGYVAHVVEAPEAPATVPFTKGDVEGMASFNQFGLRRVELSGPTVDGGAARAKELESSLGTAPSLHVSTKTEHVDHARKTSIDVDVTEGEPDGGFTVVETYRPE